MTAFFVFLLYVFGFIVALMPIFIYRELRRQGRERAAEAAKMIAFLSRIDWALVPREIDDDAASTESDAAPVSVMPSGKRIVIRR